MKKLSKQATLHLMLQGLWKGIQEAKQDPLVQEKYPRGLGFIENMVVDLGKQAKRNPNFTLSEKQVRKLNQFLGGSSGVLSAILRRHIVKHCKGNQCTMVSPNEFRFEYVEPSKPTFQINGEFEIFSKMQDVDFHSTYPIPVKSYEKMSDFLEDIAEEYDRLSETVIRKQKGVDSLWLEHSVEGDKVLYTKGLEWDYDYFTVEQLNKVYLTIFVNGTQVKDKKMLEQIVAFFKRRF